MTVPSTEKYQLLHAAMQALHAGLAESAQDQLTRLVVDVLDVQQHPEDLMYSIFAAALAKRLQTTEAEQINLYVKQFEQPQIHLFNLIARHLPFVAFAGRIANAYLANRIAGQDDITLVNIGIGTGRQELALLQLLQEKGNLPRRLTVFAIEPFPQALQEAEQALTTACQSLGIELTFHPLLTVAERLTDAQWQSFRPATGPLLINAAFALHHIRGTAATDVTVRDEIFQKMRDLHPTAVVLCEPNSDHFHPDLAQRFENCWHHFSHIFSYIDQADVTPQEAVSLKMFFVREIEDILGNAEDHRFERHERAETWRERLRAAGYLTPVSITEDVTREFAQHPLVSVQPYDGYVGLDYGDETLVAVFCGTLNEQNPK